MNRNEKMAWSYIFLWALFAWVNVQDPETMIAQLTGRSDIIIMFDVLSKIMLLIAVYTVIRKYLPKKYK